MRHAEGIEIKESLEIRTRTYYSLLHLTTAIRFTEKARIIEQKYSGSFDSELTSELNSYITSIILSIVAFLEANINEIVSDLYDGNSQLRGKTNKVDQESFKRVWDLFRHKENSFTIFEKYEIVVGLLSVKKIDKGSSLSQEVKMLIKLRNLLTHYKPEWQEWTDSPKDEKEIFKTLKGKFDLNPFFGKKEPFFPQRCLGCGCAEWGINGALNFTNEFYQMVGLTPTYEHVVKELDWRIL